MRILFLLFASVAWSQSLVGIVSDVHASSGTAATPSFSPGAGSVSNPTTVTVSTATGGCGSYIYWGTTNPPTTGDTHGTSITVSSAATYYAKVIGCPTFSDSAVGSAAYTVFTDTPVVTGQSLSGTIRSDATNCLGFGFKPNASMVFTQLGRWIISGNSGSHVLTIADNSGASLGQCTLNTSGQTAGQYAYCTLGTPVTVSNTLTAYFLLSNELNGGDQWYDLSTTVTTTGINSVADYVGTISGTSCTGLASFSGATHAWIPVNGKFH